MWTPPQWRPGFAFIFVATLGMCGAAALAHAANDAVGLGVACGAMLGLYLALALTVILSGGGMTDAAMRHLRNRVARAGGRIAAAYEIWTARPNNGLCGQDDPIEIMRRAGEGFPAPPRTQGP